MAEELSLYSATVLESDQHFFGALPKGATDSLCYLLAVYLYLPEDLDYFRALVLNRLVKTAHRYSYEGKWNLFSQIVNLEKDEPFSYIDIWYDVLQENFSQDDIFGNLAPRVRKYIRLFNRNKKKLYFLQCKHQRRAVQPQRQRGYKDKGSRILYNQSGSGTSLKGIFYSGPNPVKQEPIERYPSTSPTKRMWLGERGEGGG
jgi:hypothetical protein